MELLDGLDLETLVERYGPLPPARAVHLLTQVCESLDEAHARGLIHRDIKPANIYVCRYGRDVDFVKVLDFGLVQKARQASTQADKTLASTAPARPPTWRPRAGPTARRSTVAPTFMRSAASPISCSLVSSSSPGALSIMETLMHHVGRMRRCERPNEPQPHFPPPRSIDDSSSIVWRRIPTTDRRARPRSGSAS